MLKIRDSGRDAVVLVHKAGFEDVVVWNPAHSKVGWTSGGGGKGVVWEGCEVCMDVLLFCRDQEAANASSYMPCNRFPFCCAASLPQAAGMADLGEHWRSFVCVEVAQARSGPVALQPGQSWEGSTTVEYDTVGEGAD